MVDGSVHACGKAVQVGVYEFLAAWVLLHSRLANAGPVHSPMLCCCRSGFLLAVWRGLSREQWWPRWSAFDPS